MGCIRRYDAYPLDAFGKWMLREIHLQGISLEELSGFSGVSVNTLKEIANGSSFSLQTMEKVMNALGYPLMFGIPIVRNNEYERVRKEYDDLKRSKRKS